MDRDNQQLIEIWGLYIYIYIYHDPFNQLVYKVGTTRKLSLISKELCRPIEFQNQEDKNP
jgi:hypothetical protein